MKGTTNLADEKINGVIDISSHVSPTRTGTITRAIKMGNMIQICFKDCTLPSNNNYGAIVNIDADYRSNVAQYGMCAYYDSNSRGISGIVYISPSQGALYYSTAGTPNGQAITGSIIYYL